jgi:hypothetical protein
VSSDDHGNGDAKQRPFRSRLSLHIRVLPHAIDSAPPLPHILDATYEQLRTNSMDNNNQASTNYREAFQLFDKRGNGRVDRGSLGDLLRACGQNPTLAEITDLERGVGADCTFPEIPSPYTYPQHSGARLYMSRNCNKT